jgi:hypothetical protein
MRNYINSDDSLPVLAPLACPSTGSPVASVADMLEPYCRFDEAPPVLQFNNYVRSGYRAGMSPRQCLCSMFQYHNEIGARRPATLPVRRLLCHVLP